MRITLILALSAALLSGGNAVGANQKKDFDRAMEMYRAGLYSEAFLSFGKLDGILAEGYSVLSAVKADADCCFALAEEYTGTYPESPVVPKIRYACGLKRFDEGNFEEAAYWLARVSATELSKRDRSEYMYKKAYSEFGKGNYSYAEELLLKSERLPYSDYTAPSRYSLGYIYYSGENFKEAFRWFSESSKDPRFYEISNYYMLECRFMMRDYDYVIENGESMFDKVPEDRKPHLSRIISESYLVKGDAAKAKEYYEKTSGSRLAPKGRTDYFHSGSLLYSVGDYAGAVENFSLMGERRDSLGQIASYRMGDSYIRLRNKVAAMDAFREASREDWDPAIREDATFNAAKLAFDLGGDTGPFADYIRRYGSEGKGDRIYSYMAMAALVNHDYEGAVAAYDKVEVLDDRMKGNYMKAYYLRAAQLMGNGSWRSAVPCLKAAAYYAPRQDPFNQISRYYQAEALFRDGNYAEARQILLDLYNISALDGTPEGNLISYGIAWCYFKEADGKNAIRWFNNYLETPSPVYGADAETRIADCYFMAKEYRTAATAYEKVLKDFPDSDDLYPALRGGVACGLLGDKAGKIRFLESAKEAPMTAELWPDAMYELGRAYVDAGDRDSAVKTFNSLRAGSTEKEFTAKALIELGMLANNEGRTDSALAYYKEVVSMLPGSSQADDALLAIESIYKTTGAPDEYLAYVNSLGSSSGRTEAEKEAVYFASAEQLFLAGNYSKALTAFEKYPSLYPGGSNLAKADYYKAECLRCTGRKEQACDAYRKAVSEGLEPSFLEPALLALGNLSFSLENYSDAFSAFQTLREKASLKDNREAAAAGMMRSAFKGRNYSSAISSADLVLAFSSGDLTREADWIKAKSYLATSQRDKAFRLLETLSAYPSTSEGAEATYLIIQDLYDRGEFSSVSEKVYDFSSKAGGENYFLAKAFIVLGDTFMEQGNTAQARATYESIASGYTPDPNREDDVLDQVKMRLRKIDRQ